MKLIRFNKRYSCEEKGAIGEEMRISRSGSKSKSRSSKVNVEEGKEEEKEEIRIKLEDEEGGAEETVYINYICTH